MYKIVKIKNGEISYYSLGEGKPLFLLHGFGGTFLHWEESFLHALKQKFKVYCINYRGVGYSKSNDNNKISIPLMAFDLAQMCESLSISKASFLGYSMGGYIAQELVFNYPDIVENLYLVSTSPGGKKKILSSPQVYQKMTPKKMTVDERVQDRLEFNFPEKYHERMRQTQKKWVEQYQLPESYFDDDMRDKQKHAIQMWHESFNESRLNLYTKIYTPTLIFAGLKDLIMPYQNSINLCELIQNSTMIMFEDGGHGLLSQFDAEISKFM